LPQRFKLEGVGSAAVKFPGNPQGPKVLVNELVGFQVARALGLDCPDFGVTRVSEAVLGGPVMMVKDSIGNEHPFEPGLHFYCQWLENANTLDPNDLSGISLHNPQVLAGIPVMDLLLDNWDRSPWNPNVLVWRDGTRHRLMLLDFGLAFGSALWRAEDLDRATFRGMDEPLYSAKLEPVFSKVRWEDIGLHLERLKSLDRAAFASMVAAVPEVWLPDPAERDAMVRFLEVRSQGISEYLEARWRKAVWWS
jgi:hypothetical protein